MKATATCIFFAILSTTVNGNPSWSDYRVSGIIVDNAGKRLAVLEAPGGQQRLVRKGDSFVEAWVLDISLGGVLLQFPDGEKLLDVRSPHRPFTAVAEGISAVELRQVLEDHYRAEDAGAPLLGLQDMKQLGPDVRIVSVNEQPVDDRDQGIAAVEQAIEQGRVVRLTLSEGASLPVIYLQPRRLDSDSVSNDLVSPPSSN